MGGDVYIRMMGVGTLSRSPLDGVIMNQPNYDRQEVATSIME